MTEEHPATSATDGTPATIPGFETAIARLSIPPSSLEGRLWHLVIVAFLADTALTIYGVGAGHVEGNPLMRQALNSLGIAGIVALKSGAVAVAVACRSRVPTTHRPLVPAAISLPWLTAALVNVFVLTG